MRWRARGRGWLFMAGDFSEKKSRKKYRFKASGNMPKVGRQEVFLASVIKLSHGDLPGQPMYQRVCVL